MPICIYLRTYSVGLQSIEDPLIELTTGSTISLESAGMFRRPGGWRLYPSAQYWVSSLLFDVSTRTTQNDGSQGIMRMYCNCVERTQLGPQGISDPLCCFTMTRYEFE